MTFVILLGKGGSAGDRSPAFRSARCSAFYAFLVQLVFPMIALGWVTNIFQRGAASMGRLKYILNARAEHSRMSPTRPSVPAESDAQQQARESRAAVEDIANSRRN